MLPSDTVGSREQQMCDDVVIDSELHHDQAQKERLCLLALQPGLFRDPLICALEDHSLGDTPSFEAISYCWEPDPVLVHIQLDGVDGFKISRHLEACLRRVRHQAQTRRVWIDAICIKQCDDDVEKYIHQRKSSPAFRVCRRTLVWLGDFVEWHLGESEDVPSADPRLLDVALKEAILAWDSRSRTEGSTKRVWWRRLWCLQEFAVSPTDPTVIIGPYFLEWSHFAELAGDVLNPLFHCFRSMKTVHLQPGRGITLQELSDLTINDFGCSDDRHRIPALIGILDYFSVHSSTTTQHIDERISWAT